MIFQRGADPVRLPDSASEATALLTRPESSLMEQYFQGCLLEFVFANEGLPANLAFPQYTQSFRIPVDAKGEVSKVVVVDGLQALYEFSVRLRELRQQEALMGSSGRNDLDSSFLCDFLHSRPGSPTTRPK